MSKPSAFFKKVPKERWNDELKNRAAEYDSVENQLAVGSEQDSLTGDKLMEIADKEKQKEVLTKLIEHLETSKAIMQKSAGTTDHEDLKAIDRLIEKYRNSYKQNFNNSPTIVNAN